MLTILHRLLRNYSCNYTGVKNISSKILTAHTLDKFLMNTTPLVDPELAKALDGIRAITPRLETEPISRNTFAKFQLSAPVAPGVITEEILIEQN